MSRCAMMLLVASAFLVIVVPSALAKPGGLFVSPDGAVEAMESMDSYVLPYYARRLVENNDQSLERRSVGEGQKVLVARKKNAGNERSQALMMRIFKRGDLTKFGGDAAAADGGWDLGRRGWNLPLRSIAPESGKATQEQLLEEVAKDKLKALYAPGREHSRIWR